ncbi:beta-1,4-N-acetylgalactosaminyltransferase 3 [Aplochiton taeniatus]
MVVEDRKRLRFVPPPGSIVGDYNTDSGEEEAWRLSYSPQPWKPEYKGQANLHIFEDWCGSSTGQLRNNLHYPLYPHLRTTVGKLAVSPGWTNYGLRIFGYLHPYSDGEFVFAVGSGDNSELWLSQDDSPLNLQLLAWVGKTGNEWTAPGEFGKYASQTSRPVRLSAQSRYFFEVVHKQDDRGTDHVEVAWQLGQDGTGFTVISSRYISLYTNESALMMSDVGHVPQTAASHKATGSQWADGQADMLREDPRDTFYQIPLINNRYLQGVLPDCSYNPSYIIKDFPLSRYQGLQFIHMSYVYPNDHTRLTHMETENTCFYKESPLYLERYGFSKYMRLDLPEGQERRFKFRDFRLRLREEEDLEEEDLEEEVRGDWERREKANGLLRDYGDDYDDYARRRRRKLFSVTTPKAIDAPGNATAPGLHAHRGKRPLRPVPGELKAALPPGQQNMENPPAPVKSNRANPGSHALPQGHIATAGQELGYKPANRKAVKQRKASKAVKPVKAQKPAKRVAVHPTMTNQAKMEAGRPAEAPMAVPLSVGSRRHVPNPGPGRNGMAPDRPSAGQSRRGERRAAELRAEPTLGVGAPLAGQEAEDNLIRGAGTPAGATGSERAGEGARERERRGRDSQLWEAEGDFGGEEEELTYDLTPAPVFDAEVNWSQTFQAKPLDLQVLRSDWIDLRCNVTGNLLLGAYDSLPLVQDFMEKLDQIHNGRYSLVRVVNVEKRVDAAQGSRYFLELELRDVNGQHLRLSHYIYALIRRSRPRHRGGPFPPPANEVVLCNPVGFRWNPTATVHFIVPVKNQARWVQKLIVDMEGLYRDTSDPNFNLIITDYNSTDMDIEKALHSSSLPRYQYLKLTGNFERSAGLQAGIELIKDNHSIVFLCDLHIHFPPAIIDAVRKHCVEGRMAFAPIVMRLDCGATPRDLRGYWEVNGFGLLGIYKSDLDAAGGMNTRDFTNRWGGEDWELLDRLLQSGLEVERIFLRNFFHHYHSKRGMWNRRTSPNPT